MSTCGPTWTLTAPQAEVSEEEAGRPRAILIQRRPRCRTGRPDGRTQPGARQSFRDHAAQANEAQRPREAKVLPEATQNSGFQTPSQCFVPFLSLNTGL